MPNTIPTRLTHKAVIMFRLWNASIFNRMFVKWASYKNN